MYVARASWPSSNGKVYQSIYLRESYREGSHVRKRNIANLTHCDPQEIAAIELALRCKGNLAVLGSLDQIRLGQGPSVGALWAVLEVGSALRLPAPCRVAGTSSRSTSSILWPNRLIGDAGLPHEKWFTTTKVRKFMPESKLFPSGLLGPVA